MILGEVCTRACGFCAVRTGLPGRPPDPGEPRRVAEAVARMGLRHAVVTSVNRDDVADGGASIFAATIREVRARVPGCAVEVLIPDFKGHWDALRKALREFFYGMTVHELAVETRHARGDLDHLFMLIVFGDLIGLPILPPYYSMRLLPYVLPSIQRWKRSALRERDLTDLARVDI
jgi:hypothetical protein